jgi:hypothetical protein
VLLLFEGDLEAGILSQLTGKFPEGARLIIHMRTVRVR